jgi:DNA-binding transcriptional MocR family regulator
VPGQSAVTGRTAAEIAASVENAIRRGDLRPGERLPPIRALAAEVNAGHVTVATAYRRLRERGLVVGAGRAGTRVAARPPLPVRHEVAVPAGVRDLMSGNPDPVLLPRLPRLNPEHVLYGVEPKNEELVAQVSAAFAADDIAADHITIVNGALDGIERVLGADLRPGDRVAVEDPTFPRVVDLLAALGLAVEPVAIDETGLLPEALEVALRRGVHALILTPRAQNPGAAALDAHRAAQLRGVLADYPDVLVIEDDHAAGIAGAPACSTCDGRERWTVVRSFAKGLGPDLRVAALAGDEVTVARVEGRLLLGMGWVTYGLQRTVAAMLGAADTRKQLARAERVYSERREALVQALAAHGIEAWGRSGLNIWIPVDEEATAVAAMFAAGYAVAAGERFRLASQPAIRITTATLQPDEAPVVAAALAGAVKGGRRTYGA